MSENEMVGWHPDSMDMSLSKLLGMMKDREVLHAAVHGFSELDRTGQLNRNNSHVQSANCTIKSISVTVFSRALQ